MKKSDLTPEQIDFIKNNYLEISIMEMASKINSNFYQVRKAMQNNQLIVDKETIQKFKMKNRIVKEQRLIELSSDDKAYKNPDWVFDFWNHGLNPIVMATLTNKSIN